MLGFARSELVKNDLFPNEETLEKNVYKLITLVSAGLVPGLKAEHTGQIDKNGCETIKIIQKHGNKKVGKPEKKPKVKADRSDQGCCKACLGRTGDACKSCAHCVKSLVLCTPLIDACVKTCCKKSDSVRARDFGILCTLSLMQFALAALVLGAQDNRTGFPHFYLTEQQIHDIAAKLDVSPYPRHTCGCGAALVFAVASRPNDAHPAAALRRRTAMVSLKARRSELSASGCVTVSPTISWTRRARSWAPSEIPGSLMISLGESDSRGRSPCRLWRS